MKNYSEVISLYFKNKETNKLVSSIYVRTLCYSYISFS